MDRTGTSRPRVGGKTVNKRLPEREERLYQQWIANDRTARTLLAEMREVAAKARVIILAEEASDSARNSLRAASPETSHPSPRRKAGSA